MQPMKTSEMGLRFLIAREGNVSSMYNDNAGHCTVGVGHLVHKGPTEFGETSQRHPPAGLTKEQAEHWDLERPFFSRLSSQQVMDLLHHDVQRYEHAVNETIRVELTQWQFDALVSFCFNVGRRAFSHSTLARLVNQKKPADAALEFAKWTKANHQINAGLINRREHEKALFSKGDYRTHEHAKTKHLHRPRNGGHGH